MSVKNVFGSGETECSNSGSPVAADAFTAFDGDPDTIKALFERAPVAMLMVDDEGAIIRANDAANSLFGYARHNLVGQPIELLVPEDARLKHQRLRATFIRHPCARPMAEGTLLSAITRNGDKISVDIALNPVLSDGRAKGVILWITDNSVRNRADVAELFVKELTHRARKHVLDHQRNFTADRKNKRWHF